MAEDRASIDGATVVDNTDDRQVEFSAELGGAWHDFALRYSVLEALAGTQIGGQDDVIAVFGRFRDQAATAAARALARGPAVADPVVIDEGDID